VPGVYWNCQLGKTLLRHWGAKQEEASMRGGGILGVIVLIWLLIGVVAAYQRDYFKTDESNCATAGTIALTVVAGPLNYAGANPKVTDCNVKLPEPSQ
jgi:peptidoglycan/LPS O-acetylase OafA/YrhL